MVAFFFSITFGYGYDWINYNDFYYDSPYMTVLPFEPGLFYLMRFFVFLGLPFKCLVCFIYIFIYYCCYRFCVQLKNPMIGFYCMFSLLGFYMYSEQFRQGIALSIIILGLSKKEQEYPWKIMPYILVAALFHVSALTALLFNFIFTDNVKKLKFNAILITAFVSFLLLILSSPGLISFIPFVGSKVADYSALYSSGSSFFVYMIQQKQTYVYLALLLVIIMIYKKEKNRRILWAALSAYFLVLTKMAQFLVRFGYYFVPFLVMGLDDYFQSKSRKGYIYIHKTMFLIVVFIMSTIPFFISSYMKISTSPATIFDSKSEIERKISIRCDFVKITGVGDGVIKRCY
ncbi:EpsG family protein [Raoultella terrigena]|uniref:EpsG family protein n=1 Tax=Raoultella terrigena TaxID=577 RepID=UPI0025B06D3A|nr:EpsG family protein [Raoultella terrigena]WJV41545.1 EpsG family protein [Raoultella terrigena]